MINLGSWHSVQTMETLISNRWEVHVCTFFGNFDSLELSIMEVIGVIDILNLCWVEFSFKCSEIILVKFCCIFSCKCLFYWMLETLFIFTIYSFTSCLGKTLTEQIFTCCLWDITSISWYMLSLYILCRSTDPIFAFHWIISKLKCIINLILWWWVNMVIILLILWLTNGNIYIIFTWLLTCFINQSIDITSCASEYFILFWYVSSVAW